MATYSPRRAKTSFDHYYDLSNSYDRELSSRQSMAPLAFHQLPQPVSPVPSFRPKTAHTHINGHAPVTMISGRPASQIGNGRSNQSLRKPLNQSGYYRPPSQSGCRPPSQSGYRPPSKLNYNPDMDFQDHQFLADDNNEVVYPEPIHYAEDQQIFVRKPRQTTVRPPVFRLGSHGAPWKHVKTVINSNGSHMCWIDGSVKQEENMFFPMYWNRDPPRGMYRVQKPKPILTNSYNQRAKNGFKYWLQEAPATKYTDYSKMQVHGNQVTFRV